ncbi:MAG: C39 family peptidase [Chloroflexi bacterium]|nr:C39 family peptidase [Chloroflexota bacterium]
MQAVRVDRKKSLDSRWFQHLALLGSLGALFAWIVAIHPRPPIELGDRFPTAFLAPPSAPSQEWLPVRVPVRTTTAPDPRQVAASPNSAPSVEAVAIPPSTAPTGWVQAHRKTALFALPDASALAEAEIPQWSYLRIVDSQPNWLKVAYGGDGSRRAASTAWVPVDDVGALADQPRFVTSTQEARIWASDAATAEPLARLPRLATLELAGQERNGRLAVRLGGGVTSDGAIGWVDDGAITASRGPLDRDVPNDRTFSPYADTVKLSVPFRSQLDGSLSAASNCGPTSMSMVLEAFGIYLPTAQVRALAMRSMGIFDPFSGTTLESLRDAAEAYGLQGLDLFENGRYKRWTLDDVRAQLRAGHPVIPQLRYRLMPGREWVWVTYDHYVVITGMDGDTFIYNDPANLGGNGERTMTSQQLLRAWMNSDFPGAAVAIGRPL